MVNAAERDVKVGVFWSRKGTDVGERPRMNRRRWVGTRRRGTEKARVTRLIPMIMRFSKRRTDRRNLLHLATQLVAAAYAHYES